MLDDVDGLSISQGTTTDAGVPSTLLATRLGGFVQSFFEQLSGRRAKSSVKESESFCGVFEEEIGGESV